MKRSSTSLRGTLMVLAALLLVLTGCAQTPPGNTRPLTVGLTYIPDIQFAPFYVAEADGLFTDERLDVELRHHGAQEGLFTALVAGQEQYVIAGGDEVVQARSEGMPLVAIAQYYHSYPVVLIVPDSSTVQSMADLAGLRIGLPGKWGESWFGLQAGLAEAGLSESDVDILEIGYTAQAALTRGDVDAVVGFANNDQVQFALNDIPTRTIALGDGEDVPLVSIVLATTEEQLAAQPDASAALARAMIRGIEQTFADPEHALTVGKSYIPTLDEAGAEASARATLDATLPLWRPADGRATGELDPTAWENMTTFLLDAGLINNPVASSDVMKDVTR